MSSGNFLISDGFRLKEFATFARKTKKKNIKDKRR